MYDMSIKGKLTMCIIFYCVDSFIIRDSTSINYDLYFDNIRCKLHFLSNTYFQLLWYLLLIL